MPEKASAAFTPHSLDALEARVAQDRQNLCVPAANWVSNHQVGEEQVLDVVIIGGGMCGLLAQHALISGGVRNIAQFDRSESGLEGPWLTYARMETLRSPKHLTGPAFGYASLTFRAWHVAVHGETAWEALDKIPRAMWMEYLTWYREVLGLQVQNKVSLDLVENDGEYLRLHLSGEKAPAKSVLARKLIMATGRDGTGQPNIPGFMKGVPRKYWAHSADDINFSALRGKRVTVVGVGASAVDNAAEALEAGAKEVRHLARRKEMPCINKLMGIGSFGFISGYAALPDEWRWRMMRYSMVAQTPPPHGSTLRVSRHKNAYFHFGKAVTEVKECGGLLQIANADGSVLETDYLILGTGFTTVPNARKEFGDIADRIELWRDVYTPPEDEELSDLGRVPYLNSDFTFRERVPGEAPWLKNVYCFNYGATASLGKVSGDIPGISEGASWLTREIAASLYREDIEKHWQHLVDYDTPELDGSEWEPSEMPDYTAKGAVTA